MSSPDASVYGSGVTLLPLTSRIYIAGHQGMVGSAIWRALEAQGHRNLIGWSSSEVDLRDRDAAMDAIMSSRPDVVVDAAARVGGIGANSAHPVEFLSDNLRIQNNLFEAGHAAGVDRLLFLGSSCIYPRLAHQPITEEALLGGPLEPTNEAYAIAKIAGLIAVRSYRSEHGRRWISAMPTNLYGPGDNFDLQTAHVLPAVLRRIHEAKVSGAPAVTLWGSGTPRREFLHVDDLAAACVVLLGTYDEDIHINVGTGRDVAVSNLADMIARVVDYSGQIHWDSRRPDGTPRKLLNSSRITDLGWSPGIDLEDGLALTYEWFLGQTSLD